MWPDLRQLRAPAPAVHLEWIIGAETTHREYFGPVIYPAIWPYIRRQDKKTRQGYKYVHKESSSIRSDTIPSHPIPYHPIRSDPSRAGTASAIARYTTRLRNRSRNKNKIQIKIQMKRTQTRRQRAEQRQELI